MAKKKNLFYKKKKKVGQNFKASNVTHRVLKRRPKQKG